MKVFDIRCSYCDNTEGQTGREREWRRGRNVLSEQRQQSGWETGPSITLPVLQRQPRHALLSPYEANCKRLKLGVRSPLSLFPHALQFIALLPSTSPPPSPSCLHISSPPPCLCLLCLHRPKLICIIAGLFAESQSLCMCPLPGSAWGGGRGDSQVNTVCADGGRWKWDGLSGFLITPVEK